MRYVWLPFKLLIAAVLWVVSPSFRRTVRSKLASRGSIDEEARVGETVVAVLKSADGHKTRRIEG